MPGLTRQLEGAAAYVEQHRVFQLFEGLLQDLVVNKPADPIAHMIAALKKTPKPKVIISGAPGAQARQVCEEMSTKCGVVHIVASEIWRELAKSGNVVGKQAKVLIDAGKDVPSDLLLSLVKEKIAEPECAENGWVLEGFPLSEYEAKAMLSSGILPTRVLAVDADDDLLVSRLTSRRIDPQTSTVFHIDPATGGVFKLDDGSPADAATKARLVQRAEDMEPRVLERLHEYRLASGPMLPLFGKVLKRLDAELRMPELVAAAVGFVTAEAPTRAPRGAPRVLLLGGPGSEAEAVARALSTQFGAKLLCTSELLHTEALKKSAAGLKISSYLEAGGPEVVPEELLKPLVLAALQSEEARKRGFVLQGFPATAAQAAWLSSQGVWLRHAVHLEVGAAAALRRVTAARHDPTDGQVYHPDGNWPASLETVARLVPHPFFSEARVSKSLAEWEAGKQALLAELGEIVKTEDAMRDLSEIVERLAPCFLNA